MKRKADWLQAISLSSVMICLGIEIGQKVSYASAISLIVIWVAAITGLFNLSAQMKANHEKTAEKIDALRYRGLYPPQGQGTDEDVKRLREAGEKGLASRLYRELHGGTRREASSAVNGM